jgi:hypothetical protein
MSSESTQQSLINSSIYGIARGLCVHTLIYPFEVVKIRQQCLSDPKNCIDVARTIFQKEGATAFYKGLKPQLVKTIVKQTWVWPIIAGVPTHLKRFNLGELRRLAMTGLFISTIDAAFTTPLERAKVRAASTGKYTFSLNEIYNNGWRGFTTHWAKLSVNWITFLVAQKILRDHYRKTPEHLFSLPELAGIGVLVAGIVSFVSAPFDTANTLSQAKNLKLSQFFSGKEFRKFYRGSPVNTLVLIIHNIASVFVIDKLGKNDI